MSAPAEVRERTATIAGLHVRSIGPPDAPAILFSAGLGGGGDYWAPQVAAFAADHHVILYDHRGTGRSTCAPFPADYAVAAMAADIAAVLDGLGIAAAHVVGHAAGGIAGLALAAGTPDRLASLTIVNGWAAPDRHVRRCFEIRREILIAQGVDAYLKAQPLFLYPPAWISAHLDALDAERAGHVAGFQARDTLFARMAALERFDMRDQLAGIATPTLVMVSDDDMLVPPSASLVLAEGLPNARLVRMTRGGHAVNVTEAEPFNAVLRGFVADALLRPAPFGEGRQHHVFEVVVEMSAPPQPLP